MGSVIAKNAFQPLTVLSSDEKKGVILNLLAHPAIVTDAISDHVYYNMKIVNGPIDFTKIPYFEKEIKQYDAEGYRKLFELGLCQTLFNKWFNLDEWLKNKLGCVRNPEKKSDDYQNRYDDGNFHDLLALLADIGYDIKIAKMVDFAVDKNLTIALKYLLRTYSYNPSKLDSTNYMTNVVINKAKESWSS